MTEPQTKPKKKKSAAKKETEGLSVPEPDRKKSLTPEPPGEESKSRRSSAAEEPDGKSSRKPSTADAEAKSRKSSAEGLEPKSRKTSSEEGAKVKSRKSSQAKPEAAEAAAPEETKEDEEDDDEDGEMPLMPAPDREWDPNHVPFQAIAEAEAMIDVNAPVDYFQAPPETSKTDLHLLQDLDNRRLAELMEAFSMFDFDGDGVISPHDLKRTFGSLGRPDVEEDELQEMLSEALNPLDFDAFVVLMGYKTLELDAEEVFRDALSQWDYGTEGLISETRIFNDLQHFGERFTIEEATAALEDAPVVVKNKKDKMIDYLKFSSDLCGLRKRMKGYKPITK